MTPRVFRFEASLALALALALGTGLALAGEPATPLGKWMKPNVGAALAGQDFGTLQKSLDLVASKPPSGDYPKWAEYSKAGSAAAAKGDVKAIKAACKQCHDDYKEKYKKEFPNKAFP
jgi:cytochrome c553